MAQWTDSSVLAIGEALSPCKSANTQSDASSDGKASAYASDETWDWPLCNPLVIPMVTLGQFRKCQWDPERFVKTKSPHSWRAYDHMECYEDTAARRLVAVKRFTRQCLQKANAMDESVPENPWMELRIGMLFHEQDPACHKFVYRCHGVFEDNGDGLLAMEFLQGGDLFDYSTSLGVPGPQRETAIMPVVKSLIGAVSALHKMGIAHGDISVENIMFRGDPGTSDVVFVDFGMAVIGRLATTTSGLRGKQVYRAPEMHKTSCYDAFSADLFALGVVVYTLAMGRYPWHSTLPGKCRCYDYVQSDGIRRFVQKRGVPHAAGQTVADCMSAALQCLLATLLSDDPQRRYEAVMVLEKVLD